MNTHRVTVVGAGMGGLVAALQLAAQGLEVTVVEAAGGPGGKVRQIEVDGAPIDSGPTVMTMRWVFDQILGAVGASLDTELKLRPLSVLARHWWEDGSTLDLHADAARSADAVGAFAGADEARRFQAFCAQAREVYRTLEGPYIRGRMPGMLGLSGRLGPRGIGVLAGLVSAYAGGWVDAVIMRLVDLMLVFPRFFLLLLPSCREVRRVGPDHRLGGRPGHRSAAGVVDRNGDAHQSVLVYKLVAHRSDLEHDRARSCNVVFGRLGLCRAERKEPSV